MQEGLHVGGGQYGISLYLPLTVCEPKTALRNKIYFKKKIPVTLSAQLAHLRHWALGSQVSPGKFWDSLQDAFLHVILRWPTNSSWFVQNFPSFSTESPMAQETPQPRANQGGHPKVRLGICLTCSRFSAEGSPQVAKPQAAALTDTPGALVASGSSGQPIFVRRQMLPFRLWERRHSPPTATQFQAWISYPHPLTHTLISHTPTEEWENFRKV